MTDSTANARSWIDEALTGMRSGHMRRAGRTFPRITALSQLLTGFNSAARPMFGRTTDSAFIQHDSSRRNSIAVLIALGCTTLVIGFAYVCDACIH